VERFPEEAKNPSVQEMRIPFPTITISVSGNAPEGQIKEFVEELEDALKNLSGIDEVRIAGLREREIWVEVDPLKLYSYGDMSLGQIADTLGRRNLNLPGGLIRMERSEFSVRTEAEYENVDQIRKTILRGSSQDGFVYLSDVAEITDTFAERVSLARLDGEPAVSLIVAKTRDSNAIKVVEDIRRTVAEMEPFMPAGLRMTLTDDAAIEIKKRLVSLYSNMGVGLILVVGSFWFFIGWRPALMVAAGIPVSFLATFILLNAWGYSVNTLVLFGLILVLGLVVDDAIVVCENVYRHVENGMPLREATILGTKQITWPVLATVMTTVAAFLPLLLMGGVLGKFMGVIPVVVTLALLASLFEAFCVLPAHIAEWGGSHPRALAKHSKEARPWLQALLAFYERRLAVFLRRRYLVLAGLLALAVFTANLAYTRMEFILFGGQDLEAFAVAIEAPTGASLQETTRILQEVESRALALARSSDDIENVRSEVGSLRRMGFDRSMGTNLAEVSVDLVSFDKRSRSGHDIKDELRAQLQDITGAQAINFEETRNGPPVGMPVMVRIKGDSFDTLREIADEVKAFLRSTEGVKDIVDSFPPGKDEVRPHLDLEKVAALGLNVRTIATEIRAAYEGVEATRVYDGNEEVEVMVKLDAAHRRGLEGLNEMHFAGPNGLVPFTNIGSIERLPGYSQISHHNQKRSIQVTADIVSGVTNSRQVNVLLMGEFANIEERYPGYILEFAGEFEDTQDSITDMIRAFGITLILIYVILGGLFQSFVQPLIVMFTVPFAFIGVVIGFFAMGMHMGMFSTIGIIALAGIVVNDSLILIDFVNRERQRGNSQNESLLKASSARLRPIILTSAMSFGLFGVDDFLRPMAMAIAWGLTFSTLLCLIAIPCLYRIVDDFSVLVLRHPLGYTREGAEKAGELRPKRRFRKRKAEPEPA
jgi:multidrug efflux pump subunit AcrB